MVVVVVGPLVLVFPWVGVGLFVGVGWVAGGPVWGCWAGGVEAGERWLVRGGA